MSTFLVLNSLISQGWAARAKLQGLRVTSRKGFFGNEEFLVKDAHSNHVLVTQNASSTRNLDTSGFSPEQVAIVSVLQDCGLLKLS